MIKECHSNKWHSEHKEKAFLLLRDLCDFVVKFLRAAAEFVNIISLPADCRIFQSAISNPQFCSRPWLNWIERLTTDSSENPTSRRRFSNQNASKYVKMHQNLQAIASSKLIILHQNPCKYLQNNPTLICT
jgi:hypothetical protein